jgi:extracellular factor (EF) 3-hydroxypalmitic acid methyl ester biosynthesis protein
MEQQVLKQIGDLFVPAFDALHERYENISEQISNDLRPMHRAFSQRQLHPLTLCSPFAHRAYIKPLGYAGDYEMVNMIALNPFQGDTLFAKIVNLWFLSQWPSKAHRNRLAYLKERLENETWRVTRARRPARIFNFACGPAIEVQRFLADFRGCEQAELTLADFNEQTLDYLDKATGNIKERLGLRTSIRFQRKSVNQLIKEHSTARRRGEKPAYDFIYCAGLFDYLPDNICRQLMEIFYDWLAPDGLLAATNVDCDKPFRHMLEFVLDWHLIYRDVEGCKSLIPECVPDDARRVMKDQTGVNIFIEVRKPRCE